MVGPCAVLGQPDAASCGALRDAMPRYAGTSNTTFVQLNVRAPSPRSGCCVEQDARRCFWHAALTSASFCQSCAVRWRVLIMAPSRQGPGRSYKKGYAKCMRLVAFGAASLLSVRAHMQRAGREQRGGLAVTAPAARAQVTAGKPVYVLLSGSAYTDNYTVRLGVVPPLAANPALTVRAACRCKAQGRCHDPQCPDSAVVPVTAGARRAATHASRTCGKRPKLRSSAARAAPPLSTHAQARPAACAPPAIRTCEPRLLPIPSSPQAALACPAGRARMRGWL